MKNSTSSRQHVKYTVRNNWSKILNYFGINLFVKKSKDFDDKWKVPESELWMMILRGTRSCVRYVWHSNRCPINTVACSSDCSQRLWISSIISPGAISIHCYTYRMEGWIHGNFVIHYVHSDHGKSFKACGMLQNKLQKYFDPNC